MPSKRNVGAPNLFAKMLHLDTVWDEDVQGMLAEDSLLKQLDIGTDNFVGEDLVSAKQKQVPIQASVVWDAVVQEGFDELNCVKVAGRIRRNQQVIAKQLEATKEALIQLTLPQRLVHKVAHVGHEQLLPTSAETQRAAQAPFKLFMSSVASEGVALQAFDEIHQEDTVWDDGSTHNIDSHDGLLQKLAQGGEYLDADEWKPIVELGTDDKVTYANDPAFVSELAMNTELPKTVVWDEEISFHLDNNGDLLQQLVLGGESADDENIKLIVEWDTNKVLTDVDGLSQILEIDEVSNSMSHQLVCNHPTPTSYELHDGEQRAGQESEDISPKSYGAINFVTLKVSDTGCVLKESPTWRNAFGPGKYKMEADCIFLGETPSWQQGAFSRWSKAYSDNQSRNAFSLENLSSEMAYTGALLHGQRYCVNVCEADKKIKPTIEIADDKLLIYVDGWSLFLEQFMKFNVSVHTYSLSCAKCQLPKLCKMASSFRMQWDPGKGEHKQARWNTNRQWDPGITQLIMQGTDCECKCCTGSYLWTRCYGVVDKVFLNATTAWGQAVFRGGGNVMTHMWPRRSPRWSGPSAQVAAQSKPKRGFSSIQGRQQHMERVSNYSEIRKRQWETGGRLPPPPLSRSLPSDFFCDLLTLPVDLAGVATGITLPSSLRGHG